MKDLFGNKITESEPAPARGKYAWYKQHYHYRKSWTRENCGTCKHGVKWEYHDKYYYKCEKMGESHSSAIDVRMRHVCDNYGAPDAWVEEK